MVLGGHLKHQNMGLELKQEDEISLPDWIGETSLTLAEIGAVVCLACAQKGNQAAFRIGDENMAKACDTLKEKGVLIAEIKGKKLSIHLDLNVVAPE